MKRQIIFWTIGIILFGVVVFALGRLSGGESVSQRPPEYSLSPGGMGMISGGAGYLLDPSTVTVSPEDLVARVQQYLDRLDNSDLTPARLREFRWAYQVEVVERSTGRAAFGLMLNKDATQISPKAGPNLFWNTRYGPMIAEVGGGYGMVGRLRPQGSVSDMPITQAEARDIAEKAVIEVNANLKLHDDIDTYYGFYEIHAFQEGEIVGELDVNGYNGQVWYKDWGEPQISEQGLILDQ